MVNRISGWLQKAAIRPEDYVGGDEAKNEEAVRRGFASKAKQYLRHIPLAREAVAMYFCMLDSRTPVWVKASVAAALAYFVLPVDSIPDFIPIIGLGDDIGVIAATFSAVSSHVRPEHRDQAAEWIQSEHLGTAGA